MKQILLRLAHWWVTPKLPDVHIFIKSEDRPKELDQLLVIYVKRWLIHPVKRRIAKIYVQILQQIFGLTVVAITGSAGKTTTKEMIASILKIKGQTVFSKENIDPVYNIPTTILRCSPSTKYLVLEFGVEYPGEMDFYLWMVRPHVGVITNIYKTHTLFFGDEFGVANEKGKLVKNLESDDVAVLNHDNTHTQQIGKNLKAHVVWFGKEAGVEAKSIVIKDDLNTYFELNIDKNKINTHIPIPGKQFVYNALAASTACSSLGIDINSIGNGLERLPSVDRRMNPKRLESGALILNDTYNNNPSAVLEALETLKEVGIGKKKVIVITEMRELGKLEEESHKDIAKKIADFRPDYLIVLGVAAKIIALESSKVIGPKKVSMVNSTSEILPILHKILDQNSVVLVKGARYWQLEDLVSQLS